MFPLFCVTDLIPEPDDPETSFTDDLIWSIYWALFVDDGTQQFAGDAGGELPI